MNTLRKLILKPVEKEDSNNAKDDYSTDDLQTNDSDDDSNKDIYLDKSKDDPPTDSVPTIMDVPDFKSIAKPIDYYLSNDPQITFLKAVYRRYTTFETINEAIHSSNNLNFSNKLNIHIPRRGALLSSICVLITLPKYDKERKKIKYVKDIGNAIINQVQLYVGNNLYCDINNDVLNIQKHYSPELGHIKNRGEENQYLINLPIFDTKQNKVILPIICFNTLELYLKIVLQRKESCIVDVNQEIVNNISIEVYAKYYNPQVDERRRFAELGHEYLLNRHHYETHDFSHPNKNDILAFNELCALYGFYPDVNKIIFDFLIPPLVDVVTNLNIGSGVLDIHFAFRYERYSDQFFNYVPISDYTEIMHSDKIIIVRGNKNYFTNISHLNYNTQIKNMYAHSFAINPAAHQPSGAYNFDDTCVMKNTINTKKMLEHGVDCKLIIMYSRFDVLRIINGTYEIMTEKS